MKSKKDKRGFFYSLGMFFLGLSGHGKDVVTHLVKTGTRDVSMAKVETFIEGVEIEQKGLHLNQEDIDSYCEQYMYRKLSCPGCFNNSKCPECECEFPLKMQTPSQHCDAGEWGPNMENDVWKDYKEEFEIKFELKANFDKNAG